MLIANEGALKELRRFGKALSGLKRPEPGALREALSHTGRFMSVKPETPHQPVVAVDGSCQTVGTTYPYYLTLIQAAAFRLPPSGPLFMEQRVFTPLFPEERTALEKRAGDLQSVQVVAENRVREIMAQTELEVACRAAAEEKDALILLDGGFIHFRARGGTLFDRLVEEAAGSRCLVIGVIEEISSRSLEETIAGLWETNNLPYDREILYGCLEPGEVFIVPPLLRKDAGIGTVFARFAAHPQPVAFDFLAAQEEDVLPRLGALRALTPHDGRGIPAVIDIADRYIRISSTEVEQLVTAAVPAGVREVFLTPHRLRRSV
ncbi:MAG: DNA double-strand break repair nuclease NurA [Bacillota bacterium]